MHWSVFTFLDSQQLVVREPGGGALGVVKDDYHPVEFRTLWSLESAPVSPDDLRRR